MRLDRLDWAAGFSVTAFGVTLGIRVDDAALVPALRDRLPPQSTDIESSIVDHLYSVRAGGLIRGTRARRFYMVYHGWTQVARTLDERVALDVFESEVRVDVASSCDPWVFIHAGAVGWHGRAIIIPAPSTYGKSRLVEALVRAGATYYSDECAVLDERGHVHPYAKPIGRRSESGLPARVPASELGEVGVTPLPIGLVVLTAFEPGATWQPREATPAEGVLAILANAVRAQLAPRHVMKVLARAVEGARVLQGPRGEADAAAREMIAALDAGASPQASRVHSLS